MEYKPKVITGKVTGTGWPIDGHVLWFSQWDYDNRESWHLYGWADSEDEAVMQTVFQTETEAGLCPFGTLEKFAENWKAKKWEPQGSFCLPLDKVEVLEVKQEESTNNTREQLRAHGFDLTPKKQTDRGGIICLPGLGFKEWYATSCHMYYEIASAVTKKNIKAGTCPYCHRPIKIKEERKHGL